MNSVQQQRRHHHREISFEWSQLQISLDSSGFSSFLGLVKFAFGSERVKRTQDKKTKKQKNKKEKKGINYYKTLFIKFNYS